MPNWRNAIRVSRFVCLANSYHGETLGALAVGDVALYKDTYDSHSYTGNPLACAAALATLATLELFGQYDTLDNNRALAARVSEALDGLPEHPHFGDMRQTGVIAAIERVQDNASKNPYDWRERRGLQLYRSALDQGAILRPLGNVAYFMPPYVITPEEIGWLAAVARRAIDHTCR